MDRDEAVKLLRGGSEGLRKWNRYHRDGGVIPDFGGASFNGAYLGGVDLRQANLSNAEFCGANLGSAVLRGAKLYGADLCRANFGMADLQGAKLTGADFKRADLRGANLSKAYLCRAKLSQADLSDANFSNADLSEARLSSAYLHGTQFHGSHIRDTIFAGIDLSNAEGLNSVVHAGRSSIDIGTLGLSGGKIPDAFLRGCGLSPWEVQLAKFWDISMSPNEASEWFTTKVFESRFHGPLYLGGVFISYSHDDSGLAEKLRLQLHNEGANVWLDRHDMVAGDLEKQVEKSICLHDIVLLILSEASLSSDWGWQEIEWARKKEHDENRDVSCPVAVDDHWKAFKGDPVLMRHVKKKNVLDFSGWKTRKFAEVFSKLTTGMKLNYEKPASGFIE